MKRILTHSSMATWQRCRREHDLRYRQRVRSTKRSHALSLGSLVHAGLEAWWSAYYLGDDGALDAAVGVMSAQFASQDDGALDVFDLARADAMLVGYDARWRDAMPKYHVLAVEREFAAPLKNPTTRYSSRWYMLGGKVDAVVRELETGRELLVEHKTTSMAITPGSTYWERLRMDAQISTYIIGLRSIGFDVTGCLYDVLRKPAQKPLKANRQRDEAETPAEYHARVTSAIEQAPDEYYKRGEVVRLDSELAEHSSDLWLTSRAMRDAERASAAPRNANACERYNQLCPYFDICTGMASIEDGSRFYIAPTEHDELTAQEIPSE